MTHSQQINPHDEQGRSPLGRTMLTVVASFAVFAVVAGVLVAVSLLTRSDRVVESEVPLENVGQVRVLVVGADVVVRSADISAVRVTAEVTEGLLDTDFEVGLDGDTVVVRAACKGWVVPGCGADVTVEVPRDLPLNVQTGSGDLVAEDLATVEAELVTTSGQIRATFAEPPYGIKARSASGDIDVVVPAGDINYAVNAESANGRTETGLAHDPAGAGFITVLSDDGDVMVRAG